MGCGESVNLDPEKNKIKIWGDYFNQDTRSLLAICHMSDADIDFVEINTLKKENFESRYTELNPNASIPMLSHGHTKVIGDGESIFNYLVNSSDKVSDHFFNIAQRRKIGDFLAYFNRTIRRITIKLI